MPTAEEQKAAEEAKARATAASKSAEQIKREQEESDRQRRDQQSAVSGAQAVADAVKRVADEAVRSAQTAHATGSAGDFTISGSPGGRFTIRGDGFTGSGTVLLQGQTGHPGGRQLSTDEWGGQLIRGKLPVGVTSGEVVVRIDEKTEKRGYLKV